MAYEKKVENITYFREMTTSIQKMMGAYTNACSERKAWLPEV